MALSSFSLVAVRTRGHADEASDVEQILDELDELDAGPAERVRDVLTLRARSGSELGG
jgi:hypothetical protein